MFNWPLGVRAAFSLLSMECVMLPRVSLAFHGDGEFCWWFRSADEMSAFLDVHADDEDLVMVKVHDYIGDVFWASKDYMVKHHAIRLVSKALSDCDSHPLGLAEGGLL
jgi:hypothetical protein